MQPLLAEILNHPSDMLALLRKDDLTLVAANKNFENYFAVLGSESQGKAIFQVMGKDVSQEKRLSIARIINQRYFYLDQQLMPGHSLYFNWANTNEESCIVMRVSHPDQELASEQYSRLFQKNPAAIYKSTSAGKIISCNAAFAQLFGYKQTSQLTGRFTQTLYKNPEERLRFMQLLESRGQVLNYELELKRRDNSTAACLENAYIEQTPDGHEQISGILIDISEKNRMAKELSESEARYKILSQVSGESIAFVNDGVITDCNDQFAKLFAYDNTEQIKDQRLSLFLNRQDYSRVLTAIGVSTSHQVEVRTFRHDGQPVFLQIRGSHMHYHSQDTLVLVISDITARKKSEHALEQSVVRFRNLLEHSPTGIIILTNDHIRYVNYAACQLLDIEEEDAVFDRPFVKFIKPEFQEIFQKEIDAIRSGAEVEYREISLLNKRGIEVEVGIKSILTVYENKPSIQISLNSLAERRQLLQEQVRVRLIEEINTVLKTEIEEHKKTQQKLEVQQREAVEQRAKLESIINSTENLMMWTVDSKFRITTMNKNFAMWMQQFYNQELTLGTDIMKVLKNHVDKDFYQGQLQAFEMAFKGKPQQFEFALKNADNQTVWLQAFLNPVYMDKKLEQISCLIFDNTERKQIDRLVRDALKEKEVLLQEVHHRVKNNLQIISSILNLQSGYVKDADTLQILQESQQRIASMSYLHETLYRTADFSKLEFTKYIRTIVSSLVQSYSNNGTRVELLQEFDEVYLGIDQSIPCGLVVNELVSNAMKYAWHGRDKGKLNILLRQKPNNRIEITIADDGVGLPPSFHYAKTGSLGIQLVYTLVEQLDAKLDVKTNSKGTTFKMAFNRVS
ncbi:MAG: PAS domain S-box protein [Flavobacteriales bacterium]